MDTHNMSESQKYYNSEWSPTKESMYCMIQFIKLANATYFMTQFDQWLLSMDGETGVGGITKWHQETFGLWKYLLSWLW